ncbi:MAG TPA: hypothetical protein VNO19_04465 [Gemmatimonadales bacterium]|nr:hypothetical protein [Gemmatimonadales bacterium]
MTGVKPDAAPDPLLRQMRELERGMTIRTQELERENRRLRRLWMGTVVSVALLLGLATALVIVTARHGLPGAVADVVEARQFLLRDRDGAIRGSWSAAADGSMRLLMQTPGSKAGLSLSVLRGGASGITVRDSAGRSRAVLGLLPDQTVSLLFADENGTTRTVLSLVRGGSSTLVFADRSGSAKVGVGVDSRGQSTLTLPEPPESRAPAPEDLDSDSVEAAPATPQKPSAPGPRRSRTDR